MTETRMSTDAGRLDHIDHMRAIAVLAVIAYHFQPSLLPAGYLGVDIFFVISGYVVYRSFIIKNLDAGALVDATISNRLNAANHFIFRRLTRTLPILGLTILVAGVSFYFYLSTEEYTCFARQAWAALGLFSNFFYLASADYFAPDPQSNFFLHTWSLSIEEQFYFLRQP